MNRTSLRMSGALLSLALLADFSSAQPPGHHNPQTLNTLLFGNGSHCGHVIDLLYRYGMNTGSHRRLELQEPSPYGGLPISAIELGDLELLSTTLIAEETPTCGPIIGITLRNNSQREVTSFRVSAVAVFCKIHPTSPTTTVRVERVGPGEAMEIQLTLPVECLAMGMANGQAIGFNTLVVAIDSFDQFVESNESNNLSVVARAEIARVVASVPAPVTAPPPTDVEKISVPGPNAEAPPANPGQSAPETQAGPAPNGNAIDFESLEKSASSASALTDRLSIPSL
jgi:hypothetical protein